MAQPLEAESQAQSARCRVSVARVRIGSTPRWREHSRHARTRNQDPLACRPTQRRHARQHRRHTTEQPTRQGETKIYPRVDQPRDDTHSDTRRHTNRKPTRLGSEPRSTRMSTNQETTHARTHRQRATERSTRHARAKVRLHVDRRAPERPGTRTGLAREMAWRAKWSHQHRRHKPNSRHAGARAQDPPACRPAGREWPHQAEPSPTTPHQAKPSQAKPRQLHRTKPSHPMPCPALPNDAQPRRTQPNRTAPCRATVCHETRTTGSRDGRIIRHQQNQPPYHWCVVLTRPGPKQDTWSHDTGTPMEQDCCQAVRPWSTPRLGTAIRLRDSPYVPKRGTHRVPNHDRPDQSDLPDH